MTLAVAILLFGFFSLSPTLSWDLVHAQASQPPGVAQDSRTSKTTDQSTETSSTPEAKPAATSTTPASHAHKPNTIKKTPLRKTAQRKPVTSGCDNATTPDAAKAASASPGSRDASASKDGANQAPQKNCPTGKVVVRNGGEAEQSIQLAGGDQESQKRTEANQMLSSTDANLKKISNNQLSSEQQDTVSQIRQFVDDSRTALANGDLERGHTLAWKAQLLSEDLVKPQK